MSTDCLSNVEDALCAAVCHVLESSADKEGDAATVNVFPDSVAVVQVYCLERHGDEAKRNEGHNHHYYCGSLWDVRSSSHCYIFRWCIEHAFAIAGLLYVLLSNGVSSILHDHELEKVVVF